MSIAVDERGVWLIPVALGVAFVGWGRSLISRLASVLSLLAAAILLLPVIQAAEIASRLDANIDRAFAVSSGYNRGSISIPTFFSRDAAEKPQKTFRYASGSEASSDSLSLDFYPAHGNRHAPLVVMIHGGSWQSGARTALPELNSYIATLGYSVAAVSYRFAPAHPFPAALDDVRSAISLLRGKSAELGIDTSRIVLAGRSAGGQLALLAAYTAKVSTIKGAIGLYAPSDLIWGYYHPSNPRVLNSTIALENYLNGSPSSQEARYRSASPFTFAASTRVPTLLLHGDNDVLVSVFHSQELSRKLTANGVPHFFLELPWATHGCDYFLTGPCGQLEKAAVKRFLAIVTK